jgi:hypothetical protein
MNKAIIIGLVCILLILLVSMVISFLYCIY